MAAPIEAKVRLGSASATAAGLIDWALATWLFPHMADPTARALILAAVPGALAFAGGWLAHHTARPLANPKPPVSFTGPTGTTAAPPLPGPPGNVTLTQPPAPGSQM